MPAAGGLRVAGVRTLDGRERDIAVADGLIAAAPRGHEPTIDGRGLIALPRLADIHVHLDKTLLGEPWIPHVPANEIDERAALERELLASGRVAPLAVRAGRLIDLGLRHGTTLLQSHVDLEDDAGLARVEILLELAAARRAEVDIALVAFPQGGVVRNRRTAAALDRALALGAEAVGGLDPAVHDGDRDGQLDVIFALAEKHGCRVDVHLHEPGSTGTTTMRAIAERARALGLHGRCAVSHGYALAQVDARDLTRTASALSEADVAVVTSVPGDGRLPPLDRLRELGVRVVAASDNIRDSWSPYGDGDPLARARLAAYCSNWRTDAELARAFPLVTHNPAAVLGRPRADLRAGDPADFTLVPAGSHGELLVGAPERRTVVRAGAVVVRDGQLVP
jgi:cytosine deaminase